MNEETKKRISDINNGIIPDGYKKTKVGIVPVEWEISSLDKFIVEHIEKSTENNQYPVLTSSRKGLMFQSEYFNNHQITTSENIGYNIIPYGYVTFRSRTDDGKFVFNVNNIIDKGIVSYFYPVFTFKNNVDKSYMVELLNFSIEKRFYPYVEGTAQQVLSINKLKKLKFPIPPLPEQQKIAEILSAQDKLISLLKKKTEKLKELKKAYLQKMFPQKESKYPELRFNGFTEPWEKRELEDMCTIITKQTGFDYSTTIKPSLVTEKSDDVLPFIQNKDFNGENINLDTDFYIPKSVAENFPKITLDVPSLLISISGKIGNVGYYRLNNKAFIGGAVGICKLKKDNGRIIVYALQSDKGQEYFHSLIKASSHANITVEDIRKIKINLPRSNEECDKIADYLYNLDNLIALNQRKLEKEKENQKALMQLLLTGKVRVKL